MAHDICYVSCTKNNYASKKKLKYVSTPCEINWQEQKEKEKEVSKNLNSKSVHKIKKKTIYVCLLQDTLRLMVFNQQRNKKTSMMYMRG